MKQREIDAGGLKWTCVQALAGVTGEAAAAAQRKLEAADHVPVVCTPSGEAQSVRLNLAPDWLEGMGDDELASAIKAAQRQ
jgi:hypothetical protein